MVEFNKSTRALPIRCHVDVEFLPHEGYLITVEPSESKHPNLLNDVAPVSRSACMMSQMLNTLVQGNEKKNDQMIEYS